MGARCPGCAEQLSSLAGDSVSLFRHFHERRGKVAFALEEHKTVIPVLYRECKVPFQLRPFQYVDLRTDYARGLKTLLKVLGAEQQAAAADGTAVSAVPKENPTDVLDADEYMREAQEVRQEDERKRAAEQVRLEHEHNQAAERARLEREREREVAATKARLEQEESEPLAAARQTRLEQEKAAQERALRKKRSRGKLYVLAGSLIVAASVALYWAWSRSLSEKAKSDVQQQVANTARTIEVAGNRPWTATGILLQPDDAVTISASGGVSFSVGSAPGSPAGDRVDCDTVSNGRTPLYIAEQLPCSSLLGRIGDNGAVFYVGEHAEFRANTSGQLYLGVNDNSFGDNSGTWKAVVTLRATPQKR